MEFLGSFLPLPGYPLPAHLSRWKMTAPEADDLPSQRKIAQKSASLEDVLRKEIPHTPTAHSKFVLSGPIHFVATPAAPEGQMNF